MVYWQEVCYENHPFTVLITFSIAGMAFPRKNGIAFPWTNATTSFSRRFRCASRIILSFGGLGCAAAPGYAHLIAVVSLIGNVDGSAVAAPAAYKALCLGGVLHLDIFQTL